MCHLVLLLPVFGLALFWVLPFPVAAVLYAFILAISIWMYRLIMSAMARPVVTGAEGLIGELGEVISASRQSTQLMVHGEVWQGISSAGFRKGQSVRVTGIYHMVLEFEDAASAAHCRDSACDHKSLLHPFRRQKRK